MSLLSPISLLLSQSALLDVFNNCYIQYLNVCLWLLLWSLTITQVFKGIFMVLMTNEQGYCIIKNSCGERAERFWKKGLNFKAILFISQYESHSLPSRPDKWHYSTYRIGGLLYLIQCERILFIWAGTLHILSSSPIRYFSCRVYEVSPIHYGYIFSHVRGESWPRKRW